MFIVCGPPGSGKTTYVEAHRKPGDFVFDLDRLADVMFQMPSYPRPTRVHEFMKWLRLQSLEWLARRPIEGDAYVILSNEAHARRIAQLNRATLITPQNFSCVNLP